MERQPYAVGVAHHAVLAVIERAGGIQRVVGGDEVAGTVVTVTDQRMIQTGSRVVQLDAFDTAVA